VNIKRVKSIALTVAMLGAFSGALPASAASAPGIVALKVESFRHYREAFNRFCHE
jgi:hypothetical protein